MATTMEMNKRKEAPETVLDKPALEEPLDESPNTSTRLPQPSTGDPVKDELPKGGEDSKEIESQGVEASLGFQKSTTPVSDLDKKIRRAERFGVHVQLSEQEKRNSRAERFGTGLTGQGSDELKKSEELKRKARAERFGLPAQSTADEEAKKKARSARFATASKNDIVEEDKKKARAIRFSQAPSGVPLQANAEVNGGA